MAAEILLLALYAAVYPTLLAAVVILLAQSRPRRLLTVYLAAGMSMSIAAGLLVVFALSQSKWLQNGASSGLSWTADLTVGGLALLAAVALSLRADERMRDRRRRRHPKPEDKHEEPWSQRILSRGSTPIVILAALVINVPGAAYLVALKDIAASGYGTAEQVVLVLAFNAVMFLLAEIPLIGLWVAPERTNAEVRRLNAWAISHGRQIAIIVCVVFGVFLVARGLITS